MVRSDYTACDRSESRGFRSFLPPGDGAESGHSYIKDPRAALWVAENLVITT